jgi:hypothetical protein
LQKEEIIKSMQSVRSFVESLGGTPDAFHTNIDVLVTSIKEQLFRQVYFQTSYNASYMQFVVEILWEDDKSKPEYHSLGLHGYYNTNFQSFSFADGNLIFYDGNNKISVLGN